MQNNPNTLQDNDLYFYPQLHRWRSLPSFLQLLASVSFELIFGITVVTELGSFEALTF